MRRLHFEARSLAFVETDEGAYFSVCTKEGDHLALTISPTQCALISGEVSNYIAKRFTQGATEKGKPTEVPFSDDVAPQGR